jgi:hypothetical protein
MREQHVPPSCKNSYISIIESKLFDLLNRFNQIKKFDYKTVNDFIESLR